MVVDQLESRDISDRRVLETMGKVPRERFVTPDDRTSVYEDRPLPIGDGQTISQPYIVALMTQSLALQGNEKVLEVGTGSGYQAAVLSGLARRVFSIEINARLASRAARLLADLGHANVTVRYGDGFDGWPDEAPFDDIIVTCAAERVPGPLFDQLKEGGRLIIPLGANGKTQVLTLFTKTKGKPVSRQILDVRFVPMTGEALRRGG
jgi:protein-L-isoaspartate(D-aspartate) O-methyltransferase